METADASCLSRVYFHQLTDCQSVGHVIVMLLESAKIIALLNCFPELMTHSSE